jgi:hypothetical protein
LTLAEKSASIKEAACGPRGRGALGGAWSGLRGGKCSLLGNPHLGKCHFDNRALGQTTWAKTTWATSHLDWCAVKSTDVDQICTDFVWIWIDVYRFIFVACGFE